MVQSLHGRPRLLDCSQKERAIEGQEEEGTICSFTTFYHWPRRMNKKKKKKKGEETRNRCNLHFQYVHKDMFCVNKNGNERKMFG